MRSNLRTNLPKSPKEIWTLSCPRNKRTSEGYLDFRTYFEYATQINSISNSRTSYAVGDSICIYQPEDKPKKIAQILSFWKGSDDLLYAKIREYLRWNELCPMDPPSVNQFIRTVHSGGNGEDTRTEEQGLHPRELFMTKNEVEIPLQHIIGQVRIYNKTPKNIDSLDNDEFLLRCWWDSKKRSFRNLSTKEDMFARVYEGKIRIGTKYQAILPEFQPTCPNIDSPEDTISRTRSSNAYDNSSNVQYVQVWKAMNEEYREQIEAFLNAARNSENIVEGMVVKFKTNHETWGRISATPPDATGYYEQHIAQKFVNVEIENEHVLIPKSNIIGHFRQDKALEVLYQHNYNFNEALLALSSSDFQYSPEMHWSEEAVRAMPKLQKAASRKRPGIKYLSWESDLDGPRKNLNVIHLLSNGQEVVDPARSKESILDFALQCPLSLAETRRANKGVKMEVTFSKILRIFQVALPPEKYHDWAEALKTLTNSQDVDNSDDMDTLLEAIKFRPDLQELLMKLMPVHETA